MSGHHDPDELIKLAEKMHKPLERYLKWKVICDRYDRGKPSKIAQLISKLDKNQSYASREAQALASEEYQAYLVEWHEAEKKKAAAQVKTDNIKCRFDALQSVLSWEREQMKMR